jgi:hypothetical protein
MKKVFSLALAVAMTFAGKAHALFGGPFDNGNYSKSMEASGTYQATYTFKNGSGFIYFTTNNQLTPTAGTSSTFTGGGINSSQFFLQSSALGTQNRSLIYYKGLIYAGMATGTTDLYRNTISGVSNGSTDFGTSTAAAGSTTSGTIPVIQSGGHGYIASSSWTGKITSKKPSITFSGKGDLAIVSPDGFTAISTAVNTAITATYQALRTQVTTPATTLATNVATDATTVGNAIGLGYSTTSTVAGGTVVSVPKSLTTLTTDLPAFQSVYAAAQAGFLANMLAIQTPTTASLQNLLVSQTAATKDALTPTSAEDLDKNYTEHVKIKVFGSLKYN